MSNLKIGLNLKHIDNDIIEEFEALKLENKTLKKQLEIEEKKKHHIRVILKSIIVYIRKLVVGKSLDKSIRVLINNYPHKIKREMISNVIISILGRTIRISLISALLVMLPHLLTIGLMWQQNKTMKYQSDRMVEQSNLMVQTLENQKKEFYESTRLIYLENLYNPIDFTGKDAEFKKRLRSESLKKYILLEREMNGDSTKIDLSNAILDNISISHFDLSNIDFSSALLSKATIDSCNIENSNFRDVNLDSSNCRRLLFDSTNYLGRTSLYYANLNNVIFNDLHLAGVDFRRAVPTGLVEFNNSDLTYALLDSMSLSFDFAPKAIVRFNQTKVDSSSFRKTYGNEKIDTSGIIWTSRFSKSGSK